MNKLKLTLSILALTVSQITMADYVMKIPLEVSNGGTLPNGSIKFVTVAPAPAVEPVLPPAVEPVLPPVVDCVEVGVSAECEERLGAWEKFADDRGLSKNWNHLWWGGDLLTNMPSEPYPITHVDRLFLSGHLFTSVDGLSNITSAGEIYLSINNLTDISGLSNLTSAVGIFLSDNNLTDISGLSNLTSAVLIDLSGNNLTNLNRFPNLKTVGSIYLKKNSLTDISGLSNLTSAEYINLTGNNLTNLNGLDNIAIGDAIYIDSYYSGPKLKANSRFCTENNASVFYNATKTQLCETE